MTALPLSSTTIFAIIVLLVIAAASPPQPVTGLGSSSTIAISYGSTSATVCGIIAGKPLQRIQCYKDGQTIPIQPNISYESVSGGRDFFCGLRSGGLALLCWDTSTFRPKRIHFSSDNNRLTDLTVGNSQVCGIQANNSVALCWRFPSPDGAPEFRTITSGGGFSCGILKNNSNTVCWGGTNEIGAEIQTQFGNFTMLSFVAGESHACGVTKTGILICKGSNADGQLDVPSHSPFDFSNLALGPNHSCAMERENGLVICWGGGAKKSEFNVDETKNVSFESIVAGLDFTCGLTTKNLSLICWGPGWSGTVTVPLPMVIPGPCIQDSCRVCGVYPNSDSLCGGSGSICRSCEPELPIPAILPPIPPPSTAKNRRFLVFGIVGSVGALAGICSILYCLCTLGFCGIFHKKIHNSAQPTIASANLDTTTAPNYNGSNVPPSRSSSLKCENSRKLRRQRSGTSFKHSERAENYSLLELDTATNNFSSENKIGGGSFGIVYKGNLSDGREVAVKRGHNGSKNKKFQEKETAFDSELALLSRLHHKHLVELVGFCEENDERLLVYEYMSNGALHDHLHSKNNVEKGSSILNSWKIRIKIALDAARGIEYLHNYAVPPIIHRDIKSSNILLDSNWTAKVSDFGLSLMGPEPNQEPMSINAVGTVGYIDPEYYVLNILTAKSDVYGLGVVLLELLTGKRAVFKEGGAGPTGVVEFARPRISAGELSSVLDNRVGTVEVEEVAAVEVVAYTAMQCVNLEGKERPNVADIVANLERAMALCEDSHGSISSTTFSTASQ